MRTRDGGRPLAWRHHGPRKRGPGLHRRPFPKRSDRPTATADRQATTREGENLCFLRSGATIPPLLSAGRANIAEVRDSRAKLTQPRAQNREVAAVSRLPLTQAREAMLELWPLLLLLLLIFVYSIIAANLRSPLTPSHSHRKMQFTHRGFEKVERGETSSITSHTASR